MADSPQKDDALQSLEEFVLTCSPNIALPTDPSRSADKDASVWMEYLDDFLIHADGILALGQCLNEDGTPPKTLLNRARAAAALYHYTRQKLPEKDVKIICTGGDPLKNGTIESDEMKKLLAARNVGEADMLSEQKSTTSMETAYFALDVMREFIEAGAKEDGQPFRFVLVTSDFHMPRALYCFDACMADEKVLASKNYPASFRVEFLALPAKGGCPPQTMPDSEMGERLNERINEQSLRQRLKGERVFTELEAVPNLAKHVLGGAVKIKPLPEERLIRAVKQVDDLIGVIVKLSFCIT